jgi:hypothetical protein
VDTKFLPLHKVKGHKAHPRRPGSFHLKNLGVKVLPRATLHAFAPRTQHVNSGIVRQPSTKNLRTPSPIAFFSSL